MRKLISLCCLFCTVVAAGQVKFGLQTGLHYSNISQADLTENSGSMNFHGGLLIDIPMGESAFHVQPQLLYTALGYGKSNLQAVDNNGFTLGEIDNHRVNFIQIPVYLLYRINAGKNIFRTGLGPWIAFKTGDRLTLEGGEKFGNGTASPGNTRGLNSTLAGVGIHMGGEFSGFIVALDVHHSLNPLYKNQANADYPKWRISTAGLSLGYFINRSRK